jgi:hypothetical protein
LKERSDEWTHTGRLDILSVLTASRRSVVRIPLTYLAG